MSIAAHVAIVADVLVATKSLLLINKLLLLLLLLLQRNDVLIFHLAVFFSLLVFSVTGAAAVDSAVASPL